MWITNTREGDVLECRLQHFWLESKPRYTAISYVWGDANDTILLSLEGCDFYVTRNLHEALLQVRRWRNQPNLDHSNVFQAQDHGCSGPMQSACILVDTEPNTAET